MLERSLFWASALSGILLTGCGGPPDPGPSAGAGPAQAPAAQPVVQRLRVRAYVDDGLARSPDHVRRLSRRISAVSARLHAEFGLALDLIEVVGRPCPERRDLAPLLAELEAEGPGDADLVLAFTSGRPPRRPRMPDLVASRYAGRFVVVRTLSTLFDRQPEAQHAAEVLLILHGVAQVFGALPACAPAVMAPTPGFGLGEAGFTFTAANHALVRLHAGVDLTVGTVPDDVADHALTVLEPPSRLRCFPEALRRRQQLLRELLNRSPAVTPPPPPPEHPNLVNGRAALAAGAPDRALALCGPLAEAEPAGDASRCAGLAAAALDRHTDAARYLRAYLAHTPDDDEVVEVLAKALGRTGDDGAARALLEGYVRRHPDDLGAQLNLGIAAARLGDYAAARAAWEAVLARQPDHADARSLLRQLPR